MAFLGDLLNRRGVALEQINNPSMPLYAALSGWDGPASAGVSVNQTTAMRLIAVNACVKLIAETIAALPLETFNRGDERRTAVRKPNEAYIWDQPNPEMTPMELWEQLLGGLLLDGNAFIETPRFKGGAQAIAELWPVDPQAVEVQRTKAERKVYVIEGRAYDATQIMHIPAFRAPGGDRGLSPIGAAREAIGVSLAAEKLAGKFFGQGSVLSGLLQVQADLSGKPQVAPALAAAFQQLHAGSDNAFKVGVIDNGATFQQLSIPPGDLQFLESRKFQVVEIARLYQVPPHMIADVERSTSWGTGIEQQGIQFVVYTLLRWVRRTEQAISKHLLPTADRYARWNLSALLRGDSAGRAAYYTAGRQGGWLSADDIRRLEDMPPIGPGGDVFLMPLNYTPVNSAQMPAAPSANGSQPVPSGASQS